jgi:predicted RNase H-like HicB family nuclease
LKTYVFPVRIEPDEYGDGTPAFAASCEVLNVYTFGDTFDDALAKVSEAIELTIESMVRNGEAIPAGPDRGVVELDQTAVAVRV